MGIFPKRKGRWPTVIWRYSASLIIREKQSKPQGDTASHLSEWLSPRRTQHMLVRMWRKGNPCWWEPSTVGGNANWCSNVDNSMKVPQNTENRANIWPKNSTPEYISSPKSPLIWKDMYMSMFISALFTIAKIWKQSVSINRWDG